MQHVVKRDLNVRVSYFLSSISSSRFRKEVTSAQRLNRQDGGSTGERAVCVGSPFIEICDNFQQESRITSRKVSPTANAISKCTFVATVVA